MTIENQAVEGLIAKIVTKLKLERELIDPSFELYKRAVNSSYIAMTRIRDMSMALACVYIIMRQQSKKPIRQEAFSWNFNTSTATIRKTYVIICRVLNIDRKTIVGDKVNNGGFVQ